MTRSALKILLLTGLVIGLASCATPRVPRDQNNICSIFDTNPGWYDAVAKSARKWRAPISAQMAIVWKESSFIHDARPPRKYVAFGLIPWGRVSSAVGYSQALNGTWAWYLKDTERLFHVMHPPLLAGPVQQLMRVERVVHPHVIGKTEREAQILANRSHLVARLF